MLTPPPFKFATAPGSAHYQRLADQGAACCDADAAAPAPAGQATARPGRLKLADLDTNFQCSIIGTCLSTAALRKLMSRFIHVEGIADLDIHHEAVWLASQPCPASKALHKALDRQHESTLLRFSRIGDTVELLALWDAALRSGDIPGAYWAVLTHRHATTEVRSKVFGDVHMLSHLVGAANRADIRRLVALEQANGELRQQVEHYQERHIAREQALASLQQSLSEAHRSLEEARQGAPAAPAPRALRDPVAAAGEQVALQTQRREAAEQAAASAQAAAATLAEEAAYLRRHAGELAAELEAAEAQLRELAGDPQDDAGTTTNAHHRLDGRRILYVGGRPSSTPSIRALVERHGGVFRHHDGGLEDRKGLLSASVAWAELVVFPVDCVDHDSVGQLKRLCARQGIEFRPLRSAGLGSFAAALGAPSRASAPQAADTDRRHPCPRHG
ncbi:DUF2325 domain-containing protein [Xylophilus sp. GOD-11R]|uniref:DUF2325 domain-containing protein n=1 Tax=Xylophilus sp. GOD-11R TaxID=3089814 RepID=UPI00298C8D9B|nr:DUF2325 domain-containing protein [Xylophilus sp. GOD-11R]WPB58402.1 DUF2325 domain-containing protein [Xylophilus sp. GOD-11R]